MQYNRYEHSYLLIYLKGISTFVEFVSIYCNILNSWKWGKRLQWVSSASIFTLQWNKPWDRESKKKLYPNYLKAWRNYRGVRQGRAARVMLYFSVSTWETCHRKCVCSGTEGMMTARDRSTYCSTDCCSDQILRCTLLDSKFSLIAWASWFRAGVCFQTLNTLHFSVGTQAKRQNMDLLALSLCLSFLPSASAFTLADSTVNTVWPLHSGWLLYPACSYDAGVHSNTRWRALLIKERIKDLADCRTHSNTSLPWTPLPVV